MTTSTFNRSWSYLILNALLHHGVKHFCIAPGSRSTPLTLEAINLQKQGVVKCHTHFDERGLGFFALGIAKTTMDPVVIIVTSGTAVANLYPAIIEASITHHNLIILSADRPPELISCGANQAIQQQGIFANYPIESLNLPKPSRDYSANWVLSQIERACGKQQHQAGVIHINAPFAEPLYDADESRIYNDEWLDSVQHYLKAKDRKYLVQHANHSEVFTHSNWEEWRTKRGVIVVGKLTAGEGAKLRNWAETLGWCLICDIQSSVTPNLPYADIWLANNTVRKRLSQADIVIQFGTQIISKRVNQFLSGFNGELWIVDQHSDYLNQFAKPHTRFIAKASHFVQTHPAIPQKKWLLEPLALSKFCDEFVTKQVGTSLNEASFAHQLSQLLPPNGHLFLGNSLFVRLADAFARLPDNYPIYTNRGASGIDGLIATMAGAAIGGERPNVAIIGDISALHDLNSIALLRQITQPTTLFIINNSGGAIFDTLGVDPKVKSKYYRASHNFEFSHIATMFGIDYIRPFTWADLKTKLKQAYIRKGVTIVEIKVNEIEGSSIYQSILKQIARASID
ncbi:2-succinyl-5-enolpyruvyl-6-hydroxy-3-cyclohexene-1-carboxylate synthase [Phocoenobacter uteri]|uniref:2-succinyl-5-enolpyruvyl-6-hydroxy-3-cyclohexene-1-carboxylate synthase n=1 Tax=Phocoenobacter uteri TaxID=146806 RepID=A0A379CBY6_9PAST|nr:2-succinyl-5-enolpyruvyl-6-hydroxy-3-cyclohexene-1-carboxylic-acid synthase [Phocoenobacter uteri]MDG6881793.1 2-succinyl-5-enolpyruvyl-6-hydroxy-3-cyclohexene-1-carboxylate synthase [Phocoenobacter uteri]SUB59830.1 2-succinyl-5-enolpyruvyl-6-hydroxy-3-cyclohexene-1-carboxylate synthase [Phocoenobacter uteri]